MTERSKLTPIDPVQIEEEFAETLRQAAYIFEKEKHGRFSGSIFACQAVARFIYWRGWGAELAGPFLQIAAAFKELDRGGKPKLFSKKSAPAKERERSPERKHIHMLAAAALEVLVKLSPPSRWAEDPKKRDSAANMIARRIYKWPGMQKQKVTGLTVIAWRNQQRALGENERRQFDAVVKEMLSQPDPRQTVDHLLSNGPPGLFQS
jgi:hypothetical protein